MWHEKMAAYHRISQPRRLNNISGENSWRPASAAISIGWLSYP